eukprot:15450995-Alexandrium_andersonii.AAC.1
MGRSGGVPGPGARLRACPKRVCSRFLEGGASPGNCLFHDGGGCRNNEVVQVGPDPHALRGLVPHSGPGDVPDSRFGASHSQVHASR